MLRISPLCRLVVLFFFLAFLSLSQATTVKWGPAGSHPSGGLLDASYILASTGTGGFRYANVNNEGYDIVVVTKNLTRDGADTLAWSLENVWWFQGGAASSAGSSIPYSTVEFRFENSVTHAPVGLSGVHFRFEDAENGERLRSFAYWNSLGTKFADSFVNPRFFTYASGSPIIHQSDSSVDPGISYAGGTQQGHWIDVDLSACSISGFTFQAGRYSSSYGSLLMTGLGDLILTNELKIQSGVDQNVSAGPDFVAGTGDATLTPDSISTALDTGNVTVQAAEKQNITLYEDVSYSGNWLAMQALNIVSGTAGALQTSSWGDAGGIALTGTQSVWVTGLASDSVAGNGGAIYLTASDSIKVSSLIESSSYGVLGKGGDITFEAGRAILADIIRSGGGGGESPSGGGGAVSLSATASIQAKAIYANSFDAPGVTLVSSTITLGKSGIVAADISGTLSLLKPVGAEASSISITGTLAGTGPVLLDAGTGVINLNTSATLSGPVTVLSGTLATHGKSLPNSDLDLRDGAGLRPGVTAVGGAVSVKSLSMGSDSALSVTLTSGSVFDLVGAANTAQLDGKFKASFGRFVPAKGSVFPVVTAASLSGTFGAFQGVRLSDRVLVPEYDGTKMQLRVTDIPPETSHDLIEVSGTGWEVAANTVYEGLTTSIAGPSLITNATIIGGTASTTTTVYMSLTASGSIGFHGGTGIGGTILNLVGTGDDKFVIQLDYNEDAVIAAVGDERYMFIASSSDGSPFINAVYANKGIVEPNTPTQFFRAYNPATDFHLGYFGVDTVNNRVWAVIDHNTAYGLGVLGAAMPDGPIPVTQAATNLAGTSATLNALVNPNGYETTVIFEIGLNPDLSEATLLTGTTLANGSSFVASTLPVIGLAPETTYYYRVDAKTADSTKVGEIFSFVTPKVLPVVGVSASIPDAFELGPVSGQFTFSQSGTASVCASYVISGAGANGGRCELSSGSITVPPAGALATIAVTPIANDAYEGDQAVMLSLVSGSDYAIGSQSAAAVTIHDKPLDQWKAAWFGAEANNAAVSGDGAIHNKAGITNLMAYALGLDPNSASATELPLASAVNVAGAPTLALNFTRDPAAADVAYRVQGSSDLKNWSTVSQYSGGTWSVGNVVTETSNGSRISVQVRDSQAIGVGAMRFLRLQVLR